MTLSEMIDSATASLAELETSTNAKLAELRATTDAKTAALEMAVQAAQSQLADMQRAKILTDWYTKATPLEVAEMQDGEVADLEWAFGIEQVGKVAARKAFKAAELRVKHERSLRERMLHLRDVVLRPLYQFTTDVTLVSGHFRNCCAAAEFAEFTRWFPDEIQKT